MVAPTNPKATLYFRQARRSVDRGRNSFDFIGRSRADVHGLATAYMLRSDAAVRVQFLQGTLRRPPSSNIPMYTFNLRGQFFA